MRKWLEYAAAWTLLKALGALPRPMARHMGALLAAAVFCVYPRVRRVAHFNLHLAFPEWSAAKRRDVVRGMVRNIGWMTAEFSQFPRYDRTNIENVIVLDGHENYLEGVRRGKGVLFLTGHLGAWELSSFAHALYGHPCHFLARPVENERVDTLVSRYRCASGCTAIPKNESARAILRVLREGGVVGVLADQNTLPEEGTFVDFFGVLASTTTGLARFALRTGAAVVPGFALWDEGLGKYRLRFEPPIELARTGDEENDVCLNTAKFTKVIERVIREHPEQWMWVHKRWQVRPPGEGPLYPV